MQTRSNPFERDAVRPPKRQRCQGFTSCYEDPLFEGSLVPSISTTERPNGLYVPPENIPREHLVAAHLPR